MAYPPVTDAPPQPAAQPGDPGIPTKKKKRSAKQTDEFLALARERFEQVEEAEAEQRQRELDDLAFYNGDQWDADTLARRRAQPATSNGLPPVPARPCFVINKQREPVRQVLNQERQSDLGIELVAADDFGDLAPPIDDSEIQLREGLVRRIQRDSQAQDARTWAFARAVQAGRGYYLVMLRYMPGKTWDQEIYVQRLYNQACVSLDPAHEQPDGSDAEWGFIGRDVPWAEYKATYKRKADGTPNQIARSDNDEFRALGEAYPGWFTKDGETRSCRVVRYFYTDRETRTLAVLADGSVQWSDELPDGDEPVDTREVIEKTICWADLDGAQVLDEETWPGPDLPIVKVVGEELQPSDDERRYEGMVRPSRDSQQGFNAMVSKWVETVGLAPIPPFQVAEGQVEGYEAWYQAANTRTLPYLPYRQADLEGRPAGPPLRTQVDTPIQAIAGSVQLFDQAIQSTTGMHDPSLGRVDPTLKSGKAINAVVQQGKENTSNYLDNLTRSIRYEAQIINNLLYPIYNRPGRIARILNGQGEPESVLLHQPSVMQGGKPAPAPLDPMTGQPTPTAKTYTLTKDAHFNVAVNVTKNKGTRRQEEVELIGGMITADPALMGVFGDLFFKYQDGPGHDQLSERAKAVLIPPVQAMIQAQKQGGQAPDPAIQAMQQQLEQAKQLIQQLQQQVQGETVKAQATVEQAKIKAQADVAKAQSDGQLQIQLQHMKNAAQIEVARISAAKSALDTQAAAQEERLSTGLELQHEAEQNALDRQHEAGLAVHQAAVGAQQQAGDQAHEAQMTVQGQQASQAEAEAGRQHEADMQQQAAALAPQPEPGAGA